MQDLSRYQKKTHIEIQTKYISLLLAGSVTLVGLVFAVGVLVGSRGVESPVCESDDPLAALDKQSGEPSPPSMNEVKTRSFHNSLMIASETVPTPASLKENSKSDSEAAKAFKKELLSVAIEKPRRFEDPIPEKVNDITPGIYSLQVASFQSQREASVLVSKLKRAGHKSFLVSVNMPERGGLWYRVRVGPFTSKKTVWQYKKSFEDKEKMPVFVVKRAAANT